MSRTLIWNEPILNGWQDPPPAKLDYAGWNAHFETVPQAAIDSVRYYRDRPDADWSTYLFPPCHYLAYGARHLKRLNFDNSLAAWRLWSFVLSESERLFRARQAGKAVVATLGDLGVLPVLVNAFPDAVPFYPDCHWATPFLSESGVLFEAAQRYGLGENACFSRASLGAALKGAYFPDPALFLCASGATCDDFHAVMDLIDWSGRPTHWVDVPHVRDSTGEDGRSPHAARALRAAAEALARALDAPCVEGGRKEAIRRVNSLRGMLARLRELTYSAPRAPLPAVEAFFAEFALLHYYGDLDECARVLAHLLRTVERRVERGESPLDDPDPVRVVWVSPTPDPRVLDYWEELGGRVVGTEYLNRQSRVPLREGGDPFDALAEALGRGSMFGTTRRRAETVLAQCERFGAEGVVIGSVFGTSHCGAEGGLLAWIAKRAGYPVLQFEVPYTGAELSGQVRTRLEAFAELLKGRR